MQSRAGSASWPDVTAAGAIVALAVMACWTLSLNAQHGVPLHNGSHLGASSANPWVVAALFIVSWTLMTTAMMLPTTIPLVVLFGRISHAAKLASGPLRANTYRTNAEGVNAGRRARKG